MNAAQIRAIRTLLALNPNATDEAIASFMAIAGPTDTPAATPATVPAPVAERPQAPDRPGAIPSVKYRVRSGVTAARIAELPASLQSIVSLVNSAGALGRREITERLNHATKKVTESAVHSLKVRGILEAMPIGEDVPPVRAAKRSNGVKLGKRK